MQWATVFGKLLDPYDLKARLFPGLLVLLPAIVFLVLVYGPKNPLLVALSSVLATCGGPYLMASFVRTWGQRAQDHLNMKWGGQPSTIMMRHRDSRLPTQTKLRYHSLATTKLGIAMPTRQEELADPHKADQAYAAAADALRPQTNDPKKFPFVFKELVAYGYNRNAHGSRWVGLLVALGAAASTLLQSGALSLHPANLTFELLAPQHYFVLVVSIISGSLWCFHFTDATVEQAGYSYARRLWEALEKVSRGRQ
jgi:hypothetical protein